MNDVDPGGTQERLVAAAFQVLRTRGFRNATARLIAKTGGTNPAAIYYHFGGIPPLLIASLVQSSDRRLDAYRSALEAVDTPSEASTVLEDLHADDVSSGHLDVLTELIGGVTAEPELADGLQVILGDWIQFFIWHTGRFRDLSPARQAVEPRELASTLLSLMLGMQLFNRIDGDHKIFARGLNLGRLALGLGSESLSSLRRLTDSGVPAQVPEEP